MITTVSDALSSQRGPDTRIGRRASRRFVEFDLDRSRDSRRRYRILSSARKVAALFHHDVEDRQSLR